MDLTDPTRAVTATLDGPVLAVLAQSGKPLTVGEVAAHMPRGSEVGVRRSLARLVEQGIVHAEMMGRNLVHELNRDHVAAGIAVQLAGLRLELWQRLRRTLGPGTPNPYKGTFSGPPRAAMVTRAATLTSCSSTHPFPETQIRGAGPTELVIA